MASKRFHPVSIPPPAAAAVAAIFLAVSPEPAGAEAPPAEQLLAGSIAYHDPEGIWMSGTFRLELHTRTAAGEETERVIVVDYRTGDFEHYQTIDDVHIAQQLKDDKCRFRIDRRTDISPEERQRHDLTCENLRSLRDYHGYVWGLPMKLRDPGANLDPNARETTFEGQPVYALRVTYRPPVGNDTWTIYLNRDSLAMTGYEFLKDGKDSVGESIVLSGEARAGSVRIPSIRASYDRNDRRHLATDTLRNLHRWIRNGKPGI